MVKQASLLPFLGKANKKFCGEERVWLILKKVNRELHQFSHPNLLVIYYVISLKTPNDNDQADGKNIANQNKWTTWLELSPS